MVANEKYDRTHEIMSPDFLWEIKIKENSGNHICKCPYCFQKRGKEDKKGKLYMDKNKLRGICFSCNTAVLVLVDGQVDVDLACSVRLHRVSDMLLSKSRGVELPDPIRMSEYKTWRDDLEVMAYVISRGKHIAEQADELDFRSITSWSGGIHGVVIPFYINGKIISFQVRMDSDWMRYYLPPGDKWVYSPGGIYTRQYEDVTLCEGVFDALALKYLGFPTPIATLGSNLSELQLQFLKKLRIKNAGLAYDNSDINLSVGKVISKEFLFLEDMEDITFLPYGDPDEYVKAKGRGKKEEEHE